MDGTRQTGWVLPPEIREAAPTPIIIEDFHACSFLFFPCLDLQKFHQHLSDVSEILSYFRLSFFFVIAQPKCCDGGESLKSYEILYLIERLFREDDDKHFHGCL